jgi:hypothetical protein
MDIKIKRVNYKKEEIVIKREIYFYFTKPIKIIIIMLNMLLEI